MEWNCPGGRPGAERPELLLSKVAAVFSVQCWRFHSASQVNLGNQKEKEREREREREREEDDVKVTSSSPSPSSSFSFSFSLFSSSSISD
jgi:hypothetical protein